jgi:hypothetical protein
MTMKKGNVVQTRVFRVKRTDTTASQATQLPSQSVIIGCRTFGTASDAATTGKINLGTTTTSTEIGVLDVKTGSGLVYHNLAEFASVALDTSLLGLQQSTGIPVFVKYSETGTASTTGGDWLVILEFI